MTCIYENRVNKLAECNLLHDVLNPPKRTKIEISTTLLLYKDIYMNKHKGKVKFKNF